MSAPADHPSLDKVVLLMVSGMSHADLVNACVTRLSIEPREVDEVTTEARRRLTRAAEYNRDEQLGTAITRMNDIYARSIRNGDIKTALTAQREIHKLMDLYREATGGYGIDETDSQAIDALRIELATIRDHLLPLALAAETYPIHEHARIAADLIRDRKRKTRKGKNAASGK